MSEPRKLRCYTYVKAPYEKVCVVLRQRPLDLLKAATTTATARATSIVAALHVRAGGMDVGVDVRPYVRGIQEDAGIAGLSPVTSLDIGWEASQAPALFPSMRLALSVWPSSSDETQIELAGEYRPPFGPVGGAIDAVVGHKIAEAAVHSFLEDVGAQLRRELATHA